MSTGLLVPVVLGEFLLFDLLRLRGFQRIYDYVRATPVRARHGHIDGIESVHRAVGTASALYFRKVHCLQRAAAHTRILRRRGVDARMVIGYQSSPIKCHAWVEVDGRIVSDPTKNQEYCLVLDRL